ncbi:MAG: H-type small acid-soluble spore protein [Vallitalea sp.]|jgi:H-type small acid-soluble spore protein|nr:H-type small acid-soluble spore protein [Vallitalea sp.]
MDIRRAEEILHSKGVIDVEYDGKPIWIISIDTNNETAEVKLINNEQSQIVDVDKLLEEK